MTISKKHNARSELKKIIGIIGFGEMIKALRNSLEYSQIEMAEILNISKQELCNIEKGRKFLSVDRAVGFAQMLGMPKLTFAKYALQDQINNSKSKISGEVFIKEVA